MRCEASPRQQALLKALYTNYPGWKNLKVHKSSPSTASSVHIKKYCKQYSASHFYPDVSLGNYKGEFRCENLSRITLKNESLDILLSQDVFEHVLGIGRVLRPGGAHIFTLGWSPKNGTSKPRSILKNGEIAHLAEPQYHGNPIDKMVTYNI